MEDKTLWFITTLEKLEESKQFIVDTGCTRCVGFYDTKEAAMNTVIDNICDIWETVYHYAVVEEFGLGLYPDCKERHFFKFNIKTKKYDEIEEPKFVKNIDNFGIG